MEYKDEELWTPEFMPDVSPEAIDYFNRINESIRRYNESINGSSPVIDEEYFSEESAKTSNLNSSIHSGVQFKNNPLSRVRLNEGLEGLEGLDYIGIRTYKKINNNTKNKKSGLDYIGIGAPKKIKTSNLNSSMRSERHIKNIDLIIDSYISKPKIEILKRFFPLETITINNATDEQEELINLVLPKVVVMNKDEDGNCNVIVNIKNINNIGYLVLINKSKIRKLKIIIDKDTKVSDMIEKLEKYDDIESLIVVGADSFVKKASILLFFPNVIFRDKETIEELEEKCKNIYNKNIDSNILEIERLRDEIGNLIDKLPNRARDRLTDKLNKLILEYNKEIEKHNNSPKEGLTLEPDYFSLDMDLILKLNYLLGSLSNKAILIELLDKIEDKDISIINDINNKINNYSDIDKYFIKGMIDEILDKYRVLIEKEIDIEYKDNTLVLDNIDYKRELDKELLRILDIVNSYCNVVDEYYRELNNIKKYKDMLNNDDNKKEVTDDIIINIIYLLQEIKDDNVVASFREILNKYHTIINNNIDKYRDKYLSNKGITEIESITDIKLEFIKEINNWYDKFKLILQLENIYKEEEVRVTRGLDYGVCIHSIVMDIKKLTSDEDVLEEIDRILLEYRNVISIKDGDKIKEGQRSVFNKLCKLYYKVEMVKNNREKKKKRRVIEVYASS